MNNESRNARAAGVLIAAMTMGAIVLFALEPRTTRMPRGTLLMAESGQAVEAVVIDYVPYGQPPDPDYFNCVLHADGQVEWRSHAGVVRVAIIGSDSDRLPLAQAERLLELIGQIRYSTGVPISEVKLGSGADAVNEPQLPPQARDLHALLVRKGLVR